ncbi:MAG TPA: MFS transporter [Candidatus Sulfomarinibacteraceae bacterium]|nr:MFS transporter [Candidatus Sulfomarinibacteraceae bacterium]
MSGDPAGNGRVGGEQAGTRRVGAGRGYLRDLAALLVGGLALRPQILVIGPLLPAITADLAVDHGTAGLLGTIPVLCMGLLAPLGPVMAARLGPRSALALAILLVGGFGLIRAAVPGVPLVLLATVGLGFGMAASGPILAMIVRARLPAHPSLGTGGYVTGLIVGGSIAAAVAVPLADAFGGWRGALAIISAAALGSLVGWWILAGRDEAAAGSTGFARLPRPPLPWRRRTGWHLGLVFGTQSTLFYGTISWLPSIFVERGWSELEAAGLVAFFNVVGLAASLSVPLFADRLGSRRSQLSIASVAALVGAIAIGATGGAAPGDPGVLAAVTLLAFGIGAFFPLSLVLPVDVAEGPSDASALAAMMLLVGYLLSSTAPFVLGALRDASGDFSLSAWALAAIAATMLPLSLSVRGRRFSR